MLENQKVYVKATYSGDELHSISIMCNLVMLNFLDDVKYYCNSENYIHKYIRDKFIAKMTDTNIIYELFICNFNEISKYLHSEAIIKVEN